MVIAMIYYLGKILSHILFKLTGKVKVYGMENIPQKGPYIIVSNHQSIIDPFVLMTIFPERIKFLAAAYLFKIPIVGFMLNLGSALPVNSKKSDIKSLRKTLRFLKRGEVIGIFPEGGVSFSGKLKNFKAGWAYIALKSKAPVVPVAISGTRDVLPVGKYLPRQGEILVSIGQPENFQKQKRILRSNLEQINYNMEETVKNLLENLLKPYQ